MGRVIGGRGERGEASGITRDTGGREGGGFGLGRGNNVSSTTGRDKASRGKGRKGKERSGEKWNKKTRRRIVAR